MNAKREQVTRIILELTIKEKESLLNAIAVFRTSATFNELKDSDSRTFDDVRQALLNV